ncbi:hypothetical protein EB232_30115 [Mesorhizobium sp. NZP2077]|nr:hypothetical protein EB232_30115 [Mesorhizobium sp. NZP2077]
MGDGEVRFETDGAVILSINAGGIYSDGSRYRYQIEFTLDELEALVSRPEAGGTKDRNSYSHQSPGTK